MTDRENYEADLERVQDSEWTDGDRDALMRAIHNPAVLKALAGIHRETLESLERFRGLDMTTQVGVGEAIKLQGMTEGRTDALDSLMGRAFKE